MVLVQGQSCQFVQVCDEREWRKGPRLSSVVPSDDEGHWAQTEMCWSTWRHKPTFYCECCQIQTRFPGEAESSPAVMTLKTHMATVLVCLFQVILQKQEWTRWSRGPFQPKWFHKKKTKHQQKKKMQVHSSAGRLESKSTLMFV